MGVEGVEKWWWGGKEEKELGRDNLGFEEGVWEGGDKRRMMRVWRMKRGEGWVETGKRGRMRGGVAD